MKLFFIDSASKLNTYSKRTFDIASTNDSIAMVPKGGRAKIEDEAASVFTKIVEFDENNTLSQQFEKYYTHGEDVKIISITERILLEVALVREKFNVSGMNYKDTLPFRDKYEMKKYLSNYNILMSPFLVYDKDKRFDFYANYLECPFVLKPRLSSGSYGFYKINNEDIYNAVQKSLKKFDTPYIAEGFIEGELFHCESIVDNGTIIFSKVAKYSCPNADFKRLKPLFSTFLEDEDEIAIKFKEFNKNVLEAMPLSNGVTHHEAFLNSEGNFVFLEIASRTPGALLVPQYEKQFGISLPDISFLQQIGYAIDLEIVKNKYHVATGIFPLGNGIVKKLNYPQLKSKFDFRNFIKKGDHINGTNELQNVFADIIIYNKNKSELEEDIKYLSDFKICEL